MSGGDWKQLFAATQSGDLELVRYYIESGVDPNYQHPEILMSPLVTAILSGHTEIAIYLLNNNADPRLRSYFDDKTPVEAARYKGNEEVLSYLRSVGVPITPSWKERLAHVVNRLIS